MTCCQGLCQPPERDEPRLHARHGPTVPIYFKVFLVTVKESDRLEQTCTYAIQAPAGTWFAYVFRGDYMEASQILSTEHFIAVSAGCAGALRVIGQALEDLHIEEFSLESDGKNYVVQGKPKRRNPAREKFMTFWQSFQSRYFGSKDEDTSCSGTATSRQLRYTPEHINRLDEQHRKRGLAEQKKPDTFGLPELLRLAGNYVDRKGRLVRLSRFGQQLMLHYVTERGETKIEDLDIAWFYDLSVRMYLKRSER